MDTKTQTQEQGQGQHKTGAYKVHVYLDAVVQPFAAVYAVGERFAVAVHNDTATTSLTVYGRGKSGEFCSKDLAVVEATETLAGLVGVELDPNRVAEAIQACRFELADELLREYHARDAKGAA